jgi:hypothetical protein
VGPKTWVYVDGFNLYYGAVKDTPYKWLNIQRLCELLLPNHSINRIKYFTARVSGRPDDPDKPTRQQIYFRALRTIPNLEIVYGSFLSHEVMMPLAQPPAEGSRFVRVIRTEEKGSDVNIATHLVHDAFRANFESAVLITNDSDLQEPVRIVQEELGLEVGVLNPHRQTASRVLARRASFIKQIRAGALRASQFPQVLRDKRGEFRKPRSW